MDPATAVTLLLTPDGRRDPYPTYELLRAHGPVVGVGDGYFVVTGYAAADAILRTPSMSVRDAAQLDRDWPGWRENAAMSLIARSMLRSNPPDHNRMRRLAAGAFTARRVAELADVVTAQAATLLEELAARPGPVDFMAGFAYPLPVGVICALLGVPAGDQPWFRQRATDFTGVLEPQLTAEEADRAHRGAAELTGYFTDLVAHRRRRPGDDLVTALVQAHDGDGDRLTGDELLANLGLLLVAGFETTTNLLGNGLVALLGAPTQAARLRAGPALAPQFVAEILRYDSPVQLTTRQVVQPTRVAGAQFPAGAEVMVLLGAANRDPQRFAVPARFDPDRPRNVALSFGAGVHYCLGAPLARLEAQLALPMVLHRWPALALAAPPEYRDRLTLRGYRTLPVTLR